MARSHPVTRAATLALVAVLLPAPRVHAACGLGSALTSPGLIGVGGSPHGITFADLNHDGRPDMVVADSYADFSGPSDVMVRLMQSSGSFGAATTYGTVGNAMFVLAADFDGDGNTDVVSADYTSNYVSFFKGSANGALSPQVTFPGGLTPFYLVAGDFNNDGRLDLAVADLRGGTVSILLGGAPGGPVFSAPIAFTVGTTASAPSSVAAGDFDGDGRLDLAVTLNGGSEVALLFGDTAPPGGVAFRSPVLVPTGPQPWIVKAIDLNGDGVLDLAVADNSGLSTLLGRGDGTFGAAMHSPMASFPEGLTFMDADHDGALDAVVCMGYAPGWIQLMPGVVVNGTPTGMFAWGTSIPWGTEPFAAATADLNGDGYLDLGVVDYFTSTLPGAAAIFHGQCLPPAPEPSVAGDWAREGVAICSAPGDQVELWAAADGAGGAWLAWQDFRSGTAAIFALHLDASGQPAPGWTAGGNLVCGGFAGNRYGPQIVGDGTGGALVAWLDARSGSSMLYLQRLAAGGAVAPGWPAGGLQVSSAGPQAQVAMAPDGAGGALLVAEDHRSGSLGLYQWAVTGGGTWASGTSTVGRLFEALNTSVVGLAADAGPAGNAFVTALVGTGYTEVHRITATDASLVLRAAAPSSWPPPLTAQDGPDGLCATYQAGSGEQVTDIDATGATRWTTPIAGARPWRIAMGTAHDAVLGSGDGSSIFGLRLTGSGQLAPGWSAGGNVIAHQGGPRSLDAVTPDGVGGAYFAWTEQRFYRTDLYVAHAGADGTFDPSWPANGLPVYDLGLPRDRAFALPDGAGGALLLWSAYDAAGDRNLYAQHVSPGGATPVLASLGASTATPERVHLGWQVAGGGSYGIERSTGDGWAEVGTATPDGEGQVTYDDVAVTPGGRYGYRLVLAGTGAPQAGGETWVDVPRAASFALEAPRPNPVQGAFHAVHSLPDAASARLELFDASGRVVWSRDVGALGAGRHEIALGRSSDFHPGVFFLRLRRGRRASVTRVALLR